MLKHKHRSGGQALVEFTLAATLIFFLLAAAVDLGLIFFTMQGMRTAAQEGATFGSYPVMVMSGGELQAVDLNYNEIVNRVRNANGNGVSPNGGFQLFDLNNNGVNDSSESSIINPKNSNSFIYVENLRSTSADLSTATGSCSTDTPRAGMRNAAQGCWVRVTVSYNYRFVFPLAPAFSNTVRLRVSHAIQVRSSFIG